MADGFHHVLERGRLDLEGLVSLAARPPRFAPHEAPFWDDPHIAQQMLAAHLDPFTDAASRRPETIDRTIDWLVDRLDLRPGASVLDLGCGPGLYCTRFARRGLTVTGIDLSGNSIDYARRASHEQGLAVQYVVADYVTLDAVASFDAVVMISFDFCVLPDDTRDELLRRIRRALKPDGVFAFDVTTPHRSLPEDGASRWDLRSGGFWRPGPYLELTRTFLYADTATDLRQTLIIEPDGRTTVYRIWNQTYTPETIASVLAAQSFEVRDLWSDLAGTTRETNSSSLGVVAGLSSPT
jgi:SAM-dependent methyltransferase